MDRSDTVTAPWPWLLRLSPRTVVLVIALWVALAWTVFLAIDLFDVAGIGTATTEPLWYHLFNDRPVEWTQWIVLPVAILAAGYLAGRLAGTDLRGAATFFLVFGLGLGLMLFEDAGDARHTISDYVQRYAGERPFGLHYRFVSDFPYFLVIAALPVYAVLRYGRHLWRSPHARPYLLTGFVLYGLAGGGSAIRHLGDLYRRIGAAIDRMVFGGAFPTRPDMERERAHFFVVDGPIEESVELVAAACLLAMILAFAADLRAGRIRPVPGDVTPTPANVGGDGPNTAASADAPTSDLRTGPHGSTRTRHEDSDATLPGRP